MDRGVGVLLHGIASVLMLASCGYQARTEPGDAGKVRLADGMAGKACHTNAQCLGGTCADSLRMALGGNALAAPGGYCTATCAIDSDCGDGGECVVPAGSKQGQCLARCLAPPDCRAGYLCVDAASLNGAKVAGTCQPAPKHDRLGDHIAGAACSVDSDCAGGRCDSSTPLGMPFPDNYCTGSCGSDEDCGAGGACLSLGGGTAASQCFAGCASDADCAREHYRCRELLPGFSACYPAPANLPAFTAGKACSADGECGDTGSCAAVLPFADFVTYGDVAAPGGYCTEPCSYNADCGQGGVCIDHGYQGGICLGTCQTEADCRAGYRCLTLSYRWQREQVCVPNVPGQ